MTANILSSETESWGQEPEKCHDIGVEKVVYDNGDTEYWGIVGPGSVVMKNLKKAMKWLKWQEGLRDESEKRMISRELIAVSKPKK